MIARAALLCALTGAHFNVLSYDLATHAAVSAAAFEQSSLSTPQTLKRLGLEPWTNNAAAFPFRVSDGDVYFDVSGTQAYIRAAYLYERMVMKSVGREAQVLRPLGWLMRGAIREDDGGVLAAIRNGEPFDDPYENFNRFCNHFFDPAVSRPAVGRAYSGECESFVFDAVQWATGRLFPFASDPTANSNRQNHFTVLDAREAMWRGLTLTDRTGNAITEPGVTGENVRKIYWATTFRALGDVIHVLQDMGQPQHTRNEGHWPFNTGYEEYVDARARLKPSFVIDAVTLTATRGQLPDLIYAGYPTPRFDRYSKFFSTTPGSVTSGTGLADYSNRGFFTPASNYFKANSEYLLPSSDPTRYTIEPAPIDAVPYRGANFYYLYGNVEDRHTDTVDRISMTTASIFRDHALATGGTPVLYTLNRKNYDDRASLLIPRAVSYSTGLLDYFFRGQLEISLPDEGVYAIADHALPAGNDPQTGGFGKIKLKLQNKSAGVDEQGSPLIDPMTEGSGPRLVAIAKFRRNTCYQADLSGEYGAPGKSAAQCRAASEEIVVSNSAVVPVGINESPRPVEFVFPTKIPISATDLHLQVVYRGALGTEADAVVVESIDISEPSYVYTYTRWDQWFYQHYPSTTPGPYPFIEWCAQGGYPTYDDCKRGHGLNLRIRFSSTPDWILGYEPTSPVPPETWTEMSLQPPFNHLAHMITPVGKFTRVALLMDVAPQNKGLAVDEWIDEFKGLAEFKWRSGTPIPTIVQGDTVSATYICDRGVYIQPSTGEPLAGCAPGNIPAFVLVPSNITF